MHDHPRRPLGGDRNRAAAADRRYGSSSSPMMHKWPKPSAHWKDVIGIVGQEEHVRKYVPQLAQLIPLPAPKSEGSRVVLTLHPQSPEMLKLLEALRPVAQRIDEQVRLEQSKSNLHQIAVAMRQYVDVNKKFPRTASFGADGKPLSLAGPHPAQPRGETALPTVSSERALGQPAQSSIAGQMPKVYRSPASKLKSSDKTNYLLPVGDGAGFASQRNTPTYAIISDGKSNTILAVEANDEHAVVWTKPEDLPFDSTRKRDLVVSIRMASWPRSSTAGSTYSNSPRIATTSSAFVHPRRRGCSASGRQVRARRGLGRLSEHSAKSGTAVRLAAVQNLNQSKSLLWSRMWRLRHWGYCFGAACARLEIADQPRSRAATPGSTAGSL